MAVNYSKIFTVTDPIAHEPFTIFVEAFTPMGGETLFVIKALEGEYDTREEFEDAQEYVIQGLEKGYTRDKGEGKLYSLTLMKSGTRHLVDSLNEALQSYEVN
jgi:20S proteasome alpha/beta subunit